MRSSLSLLLGLGWLFFSSQAGIYAMGYDRNSKQVSTLRNLYIEAGRTFPLSSFPVSDRQLLEVASALEKHGTPEQVRAIGLLKADLVKPEEYRPVLKAEVSLSGKEVFSKSPPPSDLKEYLGRDPFLYAGFGLDQPLKGYAYIDIEARKRRGSDNPDFSLPLQTEDGKPRWVVENHDVKRGVLAFFRKDFDLWIGRDKIQYGPSRSSLISDPDVPYLDSLRFEYYVGPFTLSYRLSTLDNRPAENDVRLVDPYGFNQNAILNVMHRFQYQGEKFVVAVSGVQFVARPQNNFQLVDLFPVISWHNADILPNNLSLIFDLRGTPVPGLLLAAQIGFDDINGNLIGINDSDIPTIDAEIISASIPRLWGLYVELGRTHYLWGSYSDDSALSRALFRVPLVTGTEAMAMTSPYGPGAVWLVAQLSRPIGGNLELGASFELVGKKSGVDLFDTVYAPSKEIEREAYNFTTKVALPVVYRRNRLSTRAVFGVTVGGGSVYPTLELGSTFSYEN